MLRKDSLIAPSPFLSRFVLRSWWLILFFLIVFFIYDQSTAHQASHKKALTIKLEQLSRQKTSALARKKELQLQIDSQEDPDYIEMILMRKLGLVQEGQTKVLFH